MESHEGMLLIVRHGPGRGRDYPYLQSCLAHFKQQMPGLFKRIRLHETGSPEPSLSGIRAVMFWLADPLRAFYPECFAEAIRIAQRAEQAGIPVFQHPESLSNATKSRVSSTWKKAGIPTPGLVHFRDREELDRCIPGIRFPAVLRPDNLYSQIGTHWLRDVTALNRIVDGWNYYPGTLAGFVDTRMPCREHEDGSIWARFFHKKRLFVFGDIVRTTHVFFSRSPIVGMKGSIFWHYRQQRRHNPEAARELEKDCAACLRADIAYWESREDNPELFRKAVHALDLDFAAIDYSSFPDGNIMLWEANPYFHLEPWQQAILPRLRRTDIRIPGFYDSIGEFCHSLLEGTYQRGR
jgi:hypothetical protein